ARVARAGPPALAGPAAMAGCCLAMAGPAATAERAVSGARAAMVATPAVWADRVDRAVTPEPAEQEALAEPAAMPRASSAMVAPVGTAVSPVSASPLHLELVFDRQLAEVADRAGADMRNHF